MYPFIDLKAQQARIRDRLDKAIGAVLDHGVYIMGPEVKALEERLAAYCSATHAISCSSGTDALYLPLLALELSKNDAVFVPSFTFTATAEAIVLAGATPVFVDVDPVCFNMDPRSLEEAVMAVAALGRLRPAAVIPVDLFGIPAPYAEINRLAAKHDMIVLADAAQSFGGSIGNKRVGSLAHVSATSFFPAKPLGCYGDGGAIFTGDAGLAEAIRSIRVHGRASGSGSKYDNVRVGTNARLDTMQAAVLMVKMDIFDDEMRLRQHVAARYAELLDDAVIAPSVPDGMISAWAQYTLSCARRDELQAALKQDGIPAQIYYDKPLHVQRPYLDYPVAPSGLPVTEDLSQRLISLPMHPYLEAPAQEHICGVVNAFFERAES